MKQNKFENTTTTATHETATAFALAVLLLNILIFAAIGGFIWLLQALITLDGSFGAALREAALYN